MARMPAGWPAFLRRGQSPTPHDQADACLQGRGSVVGPAQMGWYGAIVGPAWGRDTVVDPAWPNVEEAVGHEGRSQADLPIWFRRVIPQGAGRRA